MSQHQSSGGATGSGDVFGAFNALLGYMGGQAATDTIFNRFLWPQRHFSHPRLESLPRLALLYSMGGPLSQTVLEAIDKAYRHGLFRGVAQGHMLGTACFKDMGMKYKMHATETEQTRESDIRNFLWAEALINLPLLAEPSDGAQDRQPRRGRPWHVEEGQEKKKILRAKIAVSHLNLTKATVGEIADKSCPFVSETVGAVQLKSLVAICIAESTGIGVMIGVAVIIRSPWCILFIVPLLMRLCGALFALHREGLTELHESVNAERHRKWEIYCPATEGRLILISGPPSVVNQFFRHYGHPIRNRFREVVQLVLVVCYGVYFPIGLLCQAVWMPVTVQYVWTIWEVCIVVAMHLDRYTQKGTHRSTTEARIGSIFAQTHVAGSDGRSRDASLLFGPARDGPLVVKATLSSTVVGSVGEAKELMKNLVAAGENT